MKIKNLLLSCMLLSGLTAAAQDQEPKTVYEFHPHWNVFVQPLGAQYTLGETKFKDLVSYNVQLGGGYQFSPVWGARLSVNAWQSKAAWEVGANYKANWKWNYVAPMLDATINLTNLFGDYNPERLFNLGVFAGIGVNIAWNNDEAMAVEYNLKYNYPNISDANNKTQNLSYRWDGCKPRFAGRVGITGDFRINDMFSVGAEVQATTIGDRYNSKRAGNADWYVNALVGVKINFGKTYTKKTIVPPAPQVQERIIERVVEKVVEVPSVKETNAVEVFEAAEPMRRDIFFTISSTKISVAEKTKVAEIAKYLKENPETSITITGYADKGTGNASINKRLSEKRAQVVVDALVKEYGIAASRIKSDAKGDTVQPFEEPILNRVSVCIAE